MINLDFHLDDVGLDTFAQLPLTLKGPCEEDHLPDVDFLKAFEHTGDIEGPTSSSSDADGSSARASAATPGHQESYQYDQGYGAVSSVHQSWNLAPQLVSMHADGVPASAPALYGAQPHQQWQQQPAIWHSAFAGAGAVQQQQQQNIKGAGESKITVSHSTIEKQRRDRINSLIDELRELVPPSASVKSPDGGDVKRPKHAVLADTIQLLKLLKDKVQHDEYERQRLQQIMHQQQHMSANGMVAEQVAPAAAASGPPAASQWVNHGIMPISLSMPAAMPESTTLVGAVSQSAQSLLQHSLSASLSSQAVAAATSNVFAPSSCPDLPQAPANLPSAVGVLVEEGPGSSFLVKVNCRDRHGLLSDITQALCNLPLQIARAAITTSNGGAVYDVFEIIAEPSAGPEPVTALDVQYHVHQALYRWKHANPAAAAAAEQNGIAISKRQRM